MQVEGFVKVINARTGTKRNGERWTAYSVKLVDEQGNESDNWYGFGFKAPKFAEGDYVRFSASEDQRGYLQYEEGSGKIVKKAPAQREVEDTPAPAPRKAGKPFAGKAGKPQAPKEDFAARAKYWEDKEQRDIEYTQPRIAYQNARTAAIGVVNLLVSHQALPLSAAGSKAAQAKRYEQILDAVNKLTVQFANDTDTLRLLEAVEDAGTVKAPKVAPLPDDDNEDEQESEGSDEGDDDNIPFD